MRRADHLQKTMTAVQSCIAGCRSDSAPLTAMENYLRRLRLNPDWSEDEVAEVERCARRALQTCTAAPAVGCGRSPATLA